MDVAVVGAGRAGTALAVLLRRAGHEIVAVSGRDRTGERAARYLPGTPVLSAAEVARNAAVVLIGTPDDRIEETCVELTGTGAITANQTVAHLSGATSLEALSTAKMAGASVLSIHPLQTFPDVEAALGRIPGSGMAITGVDETAYALGQRLAVDVGARPFRLADEMKPLYHAAAVFASNYVVAVAALAEELFAAAGVPDRDLFMPLWRATIDNVTELGPVAALTGPAVRGDAGTVAKNLEALRRNAPEAIEPYVALARVALSLAERSGRLTPKDRARVEEVLERWT
ncbi:MAG: Rossmann-like and DUF2520 domain-containing protein [Actinomycetota bacterium]